MRPGPFTVFPTREGAPPVLAPPPLIFLAYLMAAWACDFLWRWHLEAVPLATRLWSAGGLCPSAAAVGGWAVLTLSRAGTPVEPWEPTRCLVEKGPFRFSRNPLYLCLTALMVVFALAVGSAWFALAVPALFLTLHYGVVRREEAYLTGLFGDQYDAYRRRVRRWI